MAKVTDLHLKQHREEILQTSKSAQPVQKAQDEVVHKPQQQTNSQTVSQLVRKNREILIKLQTVFPFDLFLDTLTVDPTKIDYTCHILFSPGYTESIPIENITDVIIESSVLFSTLRISFANYPTSQISIKPLWNNGAKKARDIITGLVQIEKKQSGIVDNPKTDSQTMQKLGEANS